jgi:hypothetical protein
MNTMNLSRFSRRGGLLLGLLCAMLAGCSEDDPGSTAGASQPATGQFLKFTVEGPGISKRTATFLPDKGQLSSFGVFYSIGAGTDKEAISQEGERYGQVLFILDSEKLGVGSYPGQQGGMQIAVYPTPEDAQNQNTKVLRSSDEDGLPGGLDLVISGSSDAFVEGTFSGTLNCTNCTPAQSYAVTGGSFRFERQ